MSDLLTVACRQVYTNTNSTLAGATGLIFPLFNIASTRPTGAFWHTTVHTMHTTVHTMHTTVHTMHTTVHTMHTTVHTMHTSSTSHFCR